MVSGRSVRQLLAILTVLLAAGPASAEGHSLSWGLGLVHQQVREELIRPFRWDGFGGALDLGWRLESGPDRVGAELRLPGGVVTNRYGDGSAVAGFRLAGRWLHDLAPLGGGTFALGGRLQGEESLLYSYDWDEEHLYWLTSWDLGPAASWRRGLADGHGLLLELELPLVALVSRPPTHRYEKVEDLKNLGFYLSRSSKLRATSLHEHQAVTGRATWDWAISESWDFALSLELAYARDSVPATTEWLGFTLLPSFRHAL